MAKYDFRCLECGYVYEVTRPMSRATEPLFCTRDKSQCERVLTPPSFSKSGPSAFSMSSFANPSSWSHFGHSHNAGTGGHRHGDDAATD